MRYFFSFFFLASLLFAKQVSIESMISQMIMVGFSGTNNSDKWVEQIANDIQENKIGGVILYNHNIQTPSQLKNLTTFLSSIKSENPIFVAINQDEIKAQLSQREVANYKTLSEAYDVYKKSANDLSINGFNIVFGPSVDIDFDSNKSYSDMEELVIAYSEEFTDAYRDAGLINVLEHFPGLNNTIWEYRELKPYYHFIKYGKVQAIKVGSAVINQFDDKNPATLSKVIVTGLLRDKLNFDGVVFSSDLKEKAISENYLHKESIIKAINAGVDVLVYSSYFSKNSNTPKVVREVILQAIKSGEIDTKTIVNSYNRVVKLKKSFIKKRQSDNN